MKKQIPHHTHSPKDIVETADDYLLPYLRSMRDPSLIERAIIDGPAPMLEGTAFPTDPFDDQLFKLTQKVGDNYIGVYQYDIETDTWTRFTSTFLGSEATNPTAGMIEGDTYENTTDGMTYEWTGSVWLRITTKHTEGTTLPSSGMINGDTFYHTTQKKTYTYNGTSWEHIAAPSHDGLVDVSPSDHHSVFTSSQHASVEHLASMLNQALQPYNSNITFARKGGSEHNAITYTAGEIWFQDETTRQITPAGELTGLSVGNNYIYFKLDSASLFKTTVHSEAVSSGRGLLAIIIVASASEPDVPCAIQPFYAKGLNVTADTMAVTLLSAICAYLGNVEIADGRIILGDTGIIGMDAEETVRFYIGTDGRAYFAAGDIVLDEDGMNVNSGDVIIDSSGIKIFGETLKLYDTNEVLRGSIFGVTTGCLSIYAPGWILLNPSSDGVKLNTGPLFPGADGVQALGKSGASPSRWRYYAPRSILASRPSPSINTVGLFWATREVGAYKEKLWVCMQNDASGYEWVQVAIST